MGMSTGANAAFIKGMDVVSESNNQILKQHFEQKQKEKDRLDALVKDNPSLVSPILYQKLLNDIDKTGRFSFENMASSKTAGVEGAPNTNPSTLGTFGKTPSAYDLVTVTPDLAAATGLPLGTQVQKWQIQSVFAPDQRVKTTAAGQTNRQDKTIENQNERDANNFKQSIARTAYAEFLKAKQFGTEDSLRPDVADAFEKANYPQEMVDKFRAKQLAPQEETSWLGSLFSSKKSTTQPTIDNQVPKSQASSPVKQSSSNTSAGKSLALRQQAIDKLKSLGQATSDVNIEFAINNGWVQ